MNVVGTVLVSPELLNEWGHMDTTDAVHVTISKHGDGSVSLVVYRCDVCAEACTHKARVVSA